MEAEQVQPGTSGVALPSLLDRIEGLLGDADELDPGSREIVYGLLDGIDEVHRMALQALAAYLEPADVVRLRHAHPAIGWLFDAYAVGVDERSVVERALEPVRPYIDSHGGSVEVLDVHAGVVTLEMSGACSGCTASAVTLQEGIVTALHDGFPGFVRVELVEDPDATAHPPPGQALDGPQTLHQIQSLRAPAHSQPLDGA